jgi:hypothetical protein
MPHRSRVAAHLGGLEIALASSMTTAREFVDHLSALLRREHDGMADFLLALAEFDRDKLWREIGYTSLFYFLRRELGLSAGASQYRKTAAELLQRFPRMEAPLRDGRLCLSSVVQVAKVLTPENLDEVLPRFFGLSSREAEVVAVSMRPVENPPRREVVTSLGSPEALEIPLTVLPTSDALDPPPLASAAPSVTAPGGTAPEPSVSAADATPPAVGLSDAATVRTPEPPTTVAGPREAAGRAPRQPVKAIVVEPLDATWSRLHITVSRDFLAKLEAAKDALSHSRPRATADEVLEVCMDLLLAQHERRKAALVERPRRKPRPSRGRAVPAHVRRKVWKRAAGRCEWIFESGERCSSSRRLEFDHHPVPWARGGPSTEGNVKLHCGDHNQLGARRIFGDEWMDRYTRKRSTSTTAARATRAARGTSKSRAGPGS